MKHGGCQRNQVTGSASERHGDEMKKPHDKELPQGETCDRILRAAVQVFALRGFEGATLKEITELAGANIAAVNYYFRSKEELIRQVLRQLLGEVNRARDVALTAYEKAVAAGEEPGLEVLLDALIRPMVQASGGTSEGRAHISLLMQARSSPAAPHDLQTGSDDIHERFVAALGRLLPDLTRKEIIWRYDCARGAMIFILADLAPNIHRIVRLAGSPSGVDEESVILELISFTAHGLRAPSAGSSLTGRTNMPRAHTWRIAAS